MMNIPLENVILEISSSNIMECISNSYKMLKRIEVNAQSVILVHLPFMERLALLTFLETWPGMHLHIPVILKTLNILQ